MTARLDNLLRFWRARSRREQRLLCAAACCLGLVLWLQWAILPAWHQWRDARERLPALRLEAVALETVLAEAAELARAPQARATPAERAAALENSLDALGQDGVYLQTLPQTASQESAARWVVEWKDAPAAVVLDWLSTDVPVLGLQVQSLDLARSRQGARTQIDRLGGRVVLALPGEAAP